MVEKEIWDHVLKMGRQVFGHFLAEQGDGDVGDTFPLAQKNAEKNAEKVSG